jgi:anti-anti-sigma regulatory factor
VGLLLHGRIAAEWAELLERECEELSRSGFRVVLDLSEVVFIGRSGLETLGRLGRAGVRIVGCSPLIAAMLEQEGIKQTEGLGAGRSSKVTEPKPRSLRRGDFSGGSVPPSRLFQPRTRSQKRSNR